MADKFLAEHGLNCAVQLREEYLRRLQTAAFDDLGDAPDPVAMGNNIDMLRVATVEVAEALVEWRRVSGVRGTCVWCVVCGIAHACNALHFTACAAPVAMGAPSDGDHQHYSTRGHAAAHGRAHA